MDVGDIVTKDSGLATGEKDPLSVAYPKRHLWKVTYYTVGKYLKLREAHQQTFPTYSGNCLYPLVKTFNNDVLPQAPSPLEYCGQLVEQWLSSLYIQ